MKFHEFIECDFTVVNLIGVGINAYEDAPVRISIKIADMKKYASMTRHACNFKRFDIRRVIEIMQAAHAVINTRTKLRLIITGNSNICVLQTDEKLIIVHIGNKAKNAFSIVECRNEFQIHEIAQENMAKMVSAICGMNLQKKMAANSNPAYVKISN